MGFWKDAAVDSFAREAFEALIAAIEVDWREIILVCERAPGTIAASAVYYDRGGVKRGVERFFDVAGLLKAKALAFSDAFEAQGEAFLCVKLTLSSPDDLDIEFERETPRKWDLADVSQFPRQRNRA